MPFAEGASPPALVTGDGIVGRQSRSIRDTSVYAASLGLLGVLTGLALITPLNAFAEDILNHPIRGDWSARFLTIGLLATTGFWLHALTANMGGKSLAGGSGERHPSLPGVRWFNGYHAAVTDMWTGAIQVVLLIILAAAIPRGVIVFLAVYVVFLFWDIAAVAIYLIRNRAWARLAWRSTINPVALVRQMASDRFVPAYPDDVESLIRGDNLGVELMYVRGATFVMWASSLVAATSAVLWLIALNWPELAALVAGVWLVTVIGRTVLDYRLTPQVLAL